MLSDLAQAAARQARPGRHISDRGAERRWIRWRAECVHRLLAIVIGLFTELLQGVAPEIAAFRARLGTESVLTDLRRPPRAPAAARPIPSARNRPRYRTRPANTPCPLILAPRVPQTGGTAARRTDMTTNDDSRRDVALFRYGLIADLLVLPAGGDETAVGLREREERVKVPCSPSVFPLPARPSPPPYGRPGRQGECSEGSFSCWNDREGERPPAPERRS